MQVVKRNGACELLDISKVRVVVERAVAGLDVESHVLEAQAQIMFHDKMETRKIQQSLISTAVRMADLDNPDWSMVAGRLLQMDLHKEIELHRPAAAPYRDYRTLVTSLVDMGLYDERILKEYTPQDLDEAGTWLAPERDSNMEYAAIYMFSYRYLIKSGHHIMEMPQEAFLTISLLLASAEAPKQRLKVAREMYDALGSRKISLATPILLNLRRPQGSLTSCFISQLGDDLDSIFWGIHQFARVSKNGGAMGIDVSEVRASSSTVNGRPGVSGGVIPWIRIFNDTAVAVNQGGVRAGSVTLALRVWHADIMPFLELQTEAGDQRQKAFDVFPQVVLPDLFMRRVETQDKWHLVCPFEVQERLGIDLVHCWGEVFEQRYAEVEQRLSELEIVTEINARDLFKEIMKRQQETGKPYLAFIDTINRANPNKDDGMIPCVNLCVTGDTRILTERGYERAIDLYRSGDNPRVVVDGRMVEGGKDLLVTPKVSMTKTAEMADVWEVVMRDGRSLTCTNWHKFPVFQDDGSYVLTPLKDLSVGTPIYIHPAMPEEQEPLKKGQTPPNAKIRDHLIGFGDQLEEDGIPDAAFYWGHYDVVDFLEAWPYQESEVVVESETRQGHFWYAGHSKSRSTVQSLHLLALSVGLGGEVFLADDGQYYLYLPWGASLTRDQYYNPEDYEGLCVFPTETAIASITYKGQEDVYDVTVEPSNTVVFNGMVTGQCVESFSNVLPTYPAWRSASTLDVSGGLVHCCNLVSLVMTRVEEDELDTLMRLSVRILDNTIALTTPPIPEAGAHNDRYRTIGVGVMGWADWLAKRSISYRADAALAEADRVFELLSYQGFKASMLLAKERGSFEAFPVSELAKGRFLGKSAEELSQEGALGDLWVNLAKDVQKHGIRNSQIMAIAPTSSTSLVQGALPSFLPAYSVFYQDKMGAQTFPVLPAYVKDRRWFYPEMKNMDQNTIVNMTARIQKWVDTGISMELVFNRNNPDVNPKHVFEVLLNAWRQGVKTVYYVRSIQKDGRMSDKDECVSCSG